MDDFEQFAESENLTDDPILEVTELEEGESVTLRVQLLDDEETTGVLELRVTLLEIQGEAVLVGARSRLVRVDDPDYEVITNEE